MTRLNNKQICILTELKDFTETSFNPKDYLLLWCLKGKAKICISKNTSNIIQNTLIICTPQINFKHCMMSLDFEYRCLVLSKNLIEQTNWKISNEFTKISINQNDLDIINLFYEFLIMLTTPNIKYDDKLIDKTIKILIQQIQINIENYPISSIYISKDPIENTYNKFINLVSLFYNKNRDVKFYADKLNISPKYLSNICKRVSGKSASIIINQYIIKSIKHSLIYTNKSIKKIALELNFENISFFGKYTKRVLGLSSKIYRLNNQIPNIDTSETSI